MDIKAKIDEVVEKIKNDKDIPFPETENYLNKVLSAKEMYEKLY